MGTTANQGWVTARDGHGFGYKTVDPDPNPENPSPNPRVYRLLTCHRLADAGCDPGLVRMPMFQVSSDSIDCCKHSFQLKDPVSSCFWGRFVLCASILTGSRGLGSGKLLTRDPYPLDPTRKPDGFTRTRVLP
jgi:hypothetical protein